MGLLLDTENTIMIATNAADMTRQLIRLLDHSPDETLACRAAAVLGCDVLDVITTRTHES